MPEVCTRVDGEAVCVAIDLTVFEDPSQTDVDEAPGEPGRPPAPRPAADMPPRVRTRVAAGTLPDTWPRDERVAGELVKGNERVECEVEVRAAPGDADNEGLELLLFGDAVYRTILGRAP